MNQVLNQQKSDGRALRQRREPLSRETIDELIELGAATIYEAQGKRGAIDPMLKPLDPNKKIAGRALTVDSAPADNLMLHRALPFAQPGDVLVADARGFLRAGAWGDVLTLAAQTAGVAGLVIDGAVRDSQTIIDMGFPTFTRGISIEGTSKRHNGAVAAPLNLAGTIVETDDIIVGDRDGLVLIKADELEDSLARARAREQHEEEFRARILEGATTLDLLGLA